MRPINSSDLRRIDLNLSLVFFVIYDERSVTGAAARLYLTQPAISASLAKLRELCKDDLFVRVGRRLKPTPYADALQRALAPALAQLQAAFTERREFDPKTAEGVLRLGLLDDLEIALLPALAHDLRKSAPGLRISVRNTDFRSIGAQLADDEIDVAIGVFDELPSSVRRQTLMRTSYRVVYDPKHLPLKSPLSLDRYLQLDHVLVSFRGDFHGLFEEKFGAKGLVRRIVVNTPRFSALPYVIRGSALVCTMPEYLAYRFARSFGLATVAAPYVAESFTVDMAWPAYLADAPDQQWWRARLARLVRMKNLIGTEPG